MPYCTQCGRQLAEGEKCSCTSSPPMQGSSNAQQPYINGYPQQYGQYPNNGMQPPSNYPPPYDPYPYQYISYPPEKKSNAWIWAIIIPVIFIIMVTTAILVPAVQGYRVKAAQIDANNYANDIRKAADHVLAELNEEEKNIKGLYIVSSDPESDAAVPFDAGDFRQRMKTYYSSADEVEYFVIIRNGSVEYAAAAKSWTNHSVRIGTYPYGTSNPRRYSINGYGGSAGKKDTLDTLYWYAYDEIFTE
ncbi:hypothetical protein [Ruminococcus flavefaciens]|uniref:Uncharacterized protein n=1 Tax=Ruminococcus flavefaciens TaxID=1265 RepID=A0A1M7MFY4_RUMFL|nr:hypothetical protein [Ruminococcus flavefaciens]SHM89841.1 hypothetical protein SAMN04487860_12231 [Ruminococcus flavefaciens]